MFANSQRRLTFSFIVLVVRVDLSAPTVLEGFTLARLGETACTLNLYATEVFRFLKDLALGRDPFKAFSTLLS